MVIVIVAIVTVVAVVCSLGGGIIYKNEKNVQRMKRSKSSKHNWLGMLREQRMRAPSSTIEPQMSERERER
ncbi:hypothetical protein B0O80DRAFT_211635 [Mortierella sp. GBAus27b]|nr:hypothetical protein B0O80DRAFT_211635 [Mortierella sp. GBAus27b]